MGKIKGSCQSAISFTGITLQPLQTMKMYRARPLSGGKIVQVCPRLINLFSSYYLDYVTFYVTKY